MFLDQILNSGPKFFFFKFGFTRNNQIRLQQQQQQQQQQELQQQLQQQDPLYQTSLTTFRGLDEGTLKKHLQRPQAGNTNE